jgi:hypothetical protein
LRRALITAFVAVRGRGNTLDSRSERDARASDPTALRGLQRLVRQTSYPMSEDDAQWVFRCSAGNVSWEEETGWWGASDYYWNAESSQVIHFADYFVDLDEGFGFSCVLYPSGTGACGD